MCYNLHKVGPMIRVGQACLCSVKLVLSTFAAYTAADLHTQDTAAWIPFSQDEILNQAIDNTR